VIEQRHGHRVRHVANRRDLVRAEVVRQ
jgi:hypothetical protein